MTTYERPYTAGQMLDNGYPPALVRRLMADPVHAQHMIEGRAVDKAQADSGAEALSKAYRDVFGVDPSHGGRTGWR